MPSPDEPAGCGFTIIGLIIIFVVLAICGSIYGRVTCGWGYSGIKTRYSIMHGCQVEVSRERWAPIESYRVTPD